MLLSIWFHFTFCFVVYFSGGHVGGPCPLEDSWIYSSSKNTWTRLSSCSIPTHSASLIPFSKQYPDIGLLYGGTQNGPGLMNQVCLQYYILLEKYIFVIDSIWYSW